MDKGGSLRNGLKYVEDAPKTSFNVSAMRLQVNNLLRKCLAKVSQLQYCYALECR